MSHRSEPCLICAGSIEDPFPSATLYLTATVVDPGEIGSRAGAGVYPRAVREAASTLSRERHREVRLLQSAVDALELSPSVAAYLTSRYLDYLRWLENGANANLRIYYSRRIPALVLAATVPALVALNLGAVGRTITVALGILVAAATGVEHFLNSGQRWRHYRGTAELMKTEAWLFLELAGDYLHHGTHADAFPVFVDRAEMLMRDEVREYVSSIVAERRGSGNAPGP